MAATGQGAFDRLVTRKPPPRAAAPLADRTAVVSKVDDTGVYVTPLGSDLTSVVIGPCMGGYYRDVSSCPDGEHSHPLVPLPMGTRVKLDRTPDGPWIVNVDWRPS